MLGVWAHPDDEAFLSAGLMATARAAGNRVVVATATRGESGTADPLRWPPERLARLRSDELAASLASLGVAEHRWFGHRDGCCSEVTTATGADEVLRLIRDVAPDTILTFGPDGMTGHDDHRAVSAWTTAAWMAAGRPCALLYATRTPRFVERFADLDLRYGVFRDGPPVTADQDLALLLRLQGAALDRKLAALRAHASQVSALHRDVGHDRFAAWWSEEAFRLAVPPGGRPA